MDCRAHECWCSCHHEDCLTCFRFLSFFFCLSSTKKPHIRRATDVESTQRAKKRTATSSFPSFFLRRGRGIRREKGENVRKENSPNKRLSVFFFHASMSRCRCLLFFVCFVCGAAGSFHKKCVRVSCLRNFSRLVFADNLRLNKKNWVSTVRVVIPLSTKNHGR